MTTLRIRGPSLRLNLKGSMGLAGSLGYTQTTPVQTTDHIILSDEGIDGATWLFSNRAFETRWLNPGGDWRGQGEILQGATPYVSKSIASGGAQTVTVDILPLFNAWRTFGNTGMHIRNASGANFTMLSRTWATVADRPTLVVTSNTGVHNCPVEAMIRVDASSSNPIQGTAVIPPVLARFTIENVTGTPTSAMFTFKISSFFAGSFPSEIHFNRLQMQRLIYDPATQFGGVEQGIAAGVARDKDLISHPSVVRYVDLTDDTKFFGVNREFYVNIPEDIGHGGHSFEYLPEYDLTALVMQSVTNSAHIANAHMFAQDQTSQPRPGAAWKRPYQEGQELGYGHLFFRFGIFAADNVQDGYTELGMKLSALTGLYYWGNVAPTNPPLFDPDANGWDYRVWHGRKSIKHPRRFRMAIYSYDQNHTYENNPGNGDIRYSSIINNCAFFLATGRWNWFEMEVDLNTIVNGVPQSNGKVRLWQDGVRIYENLTAKVRAFPHVQIQDIMWLQLYHGGTGTFPSIPFTYKYAGFCTATQYIGPPKKVANPDIDTTTAPPTLIPRRDSNDVITNWSSLPLYTLCEVQDTKLVSLLPALQAIDPQANATELRNTFNAWGGAAYDTVRGDLHCFGGGHGGGGENNARFAFRIPTGRWRIISPPVHMGTDEKWYLDFVACHLWPINKPKPWQPNTMYSVNTDYWDGSDSFTPAPLPQYVFGSDQSLSNPARIYNFRKKFPTPQRSGATEPNWSITGNTIETGPDGDIVWEPQKMNTFTGNWVYGMPPDYIFLPQLGSTSMSPLPTHDAPNATSSGQQHTFHNWYKMVWCEWLQEILHARMSISLFNPITGVTTVLKRYGDTNDQTMWPDPVTQRVYGFTMYPSVASTRWRQFNPATATFEANYDCNLTPSSQYNFSSYPGVCQIGRELYFYKRTTPQGFFKWHMDTKAFTAIPITGAGVLTYRQQVPGVSTEFSMDYSPDLGLIVGCFSDGYMFTIDPVSGFLTNPASFVVGQRTVAVDSDHNGPYGRFRYWPEAKMFVLFPRSAGNLVVMRVG
jgi:hypothetical protein